jgi:hypothetical protein
MKETLFVIGAGASVPYGYPTGKQLKQTICDLRFDRNDSEIQHFIAHDSHRWQTYASVLPILEKVGIDRGSQIQLANEFMHSGCASIDAFVAGHTGDQQLVTNVKRAIAAILLRCESKAKLFSPDTNGNWYETVWNRLVGSATKAHEIDFSKLKILTFNYDRSFEAYLLIACENRFKLQPLEAAGIVSQLEIRHVYGCLADVYPYVESGLHFASSNVEEAVSSCADNLRLIPEQRCLANDSKGDPFEFARTAAFSAKSLLFLGYGFDELNDERLNLKSTLTNRLDWEYRRNNVIRSDNGLPLDGSLDVCLTAFGMKDAELADAKARTIADYCSWTAGGETEDCHAGIRRFMRWN